MINPYTTSPANPISFYNVEGTTFLDIPDRLKTAFSEQGFCGDFDACFSQCFPQNEVLCFQVYSETLTPPTLEVMNSIDIFQGNVSPTDLGGGYWEYCVDWSVLALDDGFYYLSIAGQTGNEANQLTGNDSTFKDLINVSSPHTPTHVLSPINATQGALKVELVDASLDIFNSIATHNFLKDQFYTLRGYVYQESILQAFSSGDLFAGVADMGKIAITGEVRIDNTTTALDSYVLVEVTFQALEDFTSGFYLRSTTAGDFASAAALFVDDIEINTVDFTPDIKSEFIELTEACPCDWSRVEYWNDADGYCLSSGGSHLVIYLPLRLHREKSENLNPSIFTFTNGLNRISQGTRRVFKELETDYLPPYIGEMLNIIASFDNVKIDGELFQGTGNLSAEYIDRLNMARYTGTFYRKQTDCQKIIC